MRQDFNFRFLQFAIDRNDETAFRWFENLRLAKTQPFVRRVRRIEHAAVGMEFYPNDSRMAAARAVRLGKGQWYVR